MRFDLVIMLSTVRHVCFIDAVFVCV